MCGIFGAVSCSRPFIAYHYQQFAKLTDLVYHRGPDHTGYLSFAADGTPDNGSFNIFLGNTRLSIVDISAGGNLPMSKGHLHIAYNGEIFNHNKLRKKLAQAGCTFTTRTDTEVILNTYLAYGEEGFQKFNGMWAFVLYDAARRKVIASRDRFSIKPLYYVQSGDQWYFSSEIKQLLPLVGAAVNKSTIFKFINQGLINTCNETFYTDIHKLTPKHNLIIDLATGTAVQKQYWNYSQQQVNITDADEQFRCLLTNSVRLRVPVEVKAGTLLSGGLDSSAIACIVAGITGNTLPTFSVVANNVRYSEEPFINMVSDKHGIANHKFSFMLADYASYLEKVWHHADEPFGTLSCIAQYGIFQQIRQSSGLKVIFTGQGGDEVMMGYNKYLFFYLAQLKRERRFAALTALLLHTLIKRTVLAQFKLTLAKRYIPFLAAKGKNYMTYTEAPEVIWQTSSLRTRQELDLDRYSVPALTAYEDTFSMASSIETRHPFLDHRLVEFLLNIPPSLKISRGWTKYILRHNIHELPEKVRWRKDKKNFITPEELWMKTAFRQNFMDTMNKSKLQELGMIDSRKVLEAYERFVGRISLISFSDMFRIYITELWLCTVDEKRKLLTS